MRATYARMQAQDQVIREDGQVAGRKAYDRATYLEDVKALRRRGWTWQRIARELGLSLSTLHRIARGE